MPLEIVFRRSAEQDLDEIDDLLADYSLTAAEKLTARIKERCRLLAEYPNAGVPCPEFGPGLRSFAIPGKALVLYRFDEKTLEVLRIFYAGRHWDRPARLKEDE